jgi:integrase/recombinase XerD
MEAEMNLSKALKDYMKIRTYSGFKLRSVKNVLEKFITFMKINKSSHITVTEALNFSTKSKKCSSFEHSRKLRIIRQFSIYVKMFDFKTEIPPKDALPVSYQRRTPYIYTKEEIIGVLNACIKIKSSNSFYPLTFYTLFGLVSVTGMRTQEAINLERSSIDMDLGIITINGTKFNRSRKIPIHSTTIQALKEYDKERDKAFKNHISSYFFVNNVGKKLVSSTVQKIYREVCVEAGLRSKFESSGPRIIDFRHTLAVSTLIRCYRECLNVDNVMPILSTYLGHINPENTYWYLTATPELLNLINKQLE